MRGQCVWEERTLDFPCEIEILKIFGDSHERKAVVWQEQVLLLRMSSYSSAIMIALFVRVSF